MVLIDPWGSALIENYEKIISDFGLEEFNPSLFPKANRLMRRNVVFAARDQKIISDAIRQKKRFYVLSGIMPSAEKIHLGTKMVVENIRYFQEMGADAYILIADLEAAAARGIPLNESRKYALQFHIPAFIALGLDAKKTKFYFQSENKKVMNLAYEFAKRITLNEFRSIYGNAEPGRIMSAVTQAADILYPQIEKRMPGVIPVGIDQDPHIRLTRDVASRMKKYKFIAPSAIYHKFTPSLDGDFKMSKSKPESMIELPEKVEDVIRKLKKAKTGGRDTEEEQRRIGGEPEKCMIFEMYKQHLLENEKDLNKVYIDCKRGKLLCGEDKMNACEIARKFMNRFSKELEKARKKVKKIKFVKFE